MGLFMLIVGGFIVWGLTFYFLDRPSVAAWKVRDIYRVVALILFIMLILTSYKANTYRMELRQIIAICQ
jgi:uncharacterized membrane protein